MFNKLINKRNWISEYITVKKVIKQYDGDFNTKQAAFINTENIYRKKCFLDDNGLSVLKTSNTKRFYEILIKLKSSRHFMEKVWSRKFKICITIQDWSQIYFRRVKSIPCKKLAEFNYKLIHNLVFSGYIINKWNSSVPRKCTYCGELETIEHLLFSCRRVQNIWQTVGQILKLNITWQCIILGLEDQYANKLNTARNIIITIITYSIYVSWLRCENSKHCYKYINLIKSIKYYQQLYLKIFEKFLQSREWYRHFTSFSILINNNL